jgi:hypothetical protein
MENRAGHAPRVNERKKRMGPNKKTARLAGILWLLMIALGLFAQIGVRETLIVPGSAAATAANISANTFLFRLGFVSDLAMMVCYLLTPLVFYKLFSAVNKSLSALMVIFAMVGTAIGMLGLLCEYAALQMLSGASYLGAFSASQLQAQAMLLLDLNDHAYMIAHIFFALWVLPLGILTYRSGFLPRVFGILFIVETIAGLLSIIIHFLSPGGTLETNLLWLGALAEFSFTFWLLFRGIREPKAGALQPVAVQS